jgi:hypothetical protein
MVISQQEITAMISGIRFTLWCEGQSWVSRRKDKWKIRRVMNDAWPWNIATMIKANENSMWLGRGAISLLCLCDGDS